MNSPFTDPSGDTITPDDAFELALIAMWPDKNIDLIEDLTSPYAKMVAENIVEPVKHRNIPHVCHAAAALLSWANRSPKQMHPKR